MIQINYLKDNDLLRYSDSVQKKKKKNRNVDRQHLK